MTKQSGRDLDAEIAEKLMGFRRVMVGCDAHGAYGGTEVLLPPGMTERDSWLYLPKIGPIHLGYFAAQWSMRIDDALSLWDHLAKRGWQCSLVHKPFEKEPDDQWVFHGVRLENTGHSQRIGDFSAHADTRELAIARGALALSATSHGAPEPPDSTTGKHERGLLNLPAGDAGQTKTEGDHKQRD
jgi:hypothetical protein